MKNDILRCDALKIIESAIKKADPYDATLEILRNLSLENDNINILSVGKAAVPMAMAAEDCFGSGRLQGLVVTKYDHLGEYKSKCFECMEASHPISDENSVIAAEKALNFAEGLGENDVLIVLLSGGGSALMEKSILSPELQKSVTACLLSRGAEIEEINAVRRKISLIKGGKLADAAFPAKVITIALSDVLSNDKSTIASGPTTEDKTDTDALLRIIDKYLPEYKNEIASVPLNFREPRINDGGFYFAGDINSLCYAAEAKAMELGYSVVPLGRNITGEARVQAEKILNGIPQKNGKIAYIGGGETTVTLNGTGKGGRNQEMALAAGIKLNGKSGILFASVGSDGTDGPTDAAGGIADGDTYCKMKNAGLCPENELLNNNSYVALKMCGDLVVTGPTGTNVNDLTFVLTDF